MEVDYSGVEVRVAACYHKDPRMIQYIVDPSSDMHRDMAAQIFMLETDKVEKAVRHSSKNQFVFPQFYGDYYLNSAKAMWGSITKFNLENGDGVRLDKHLKKKGISDRGACNSKEKPIKGTFEYHMREVENDFWGNRFGVYGDWKKDWWSRYQRTGGFKTLTGFRIDGVMGKNDVINYPVQGSAFHCLLWSLCQMSKEIRRRKMNTYLCGQIHDSIVADVPIEEAEDFLHLVKYVMTERIKKWATWLNVPLDVEAEVVPVGKTWYDKKEVEFSESSYKMGDVEAESMEELLEQLEQ